MLFSKLSKEELSMADRLRLRYERWRLDTLLSGDHQLHRIR